MITDAFTSTKHGHGIRQKHKKCPAAFRATLLLVFSEARCVPYDVLRDTLDLFFDFDGSGKAAAMPKLRDEARFPARICSARNICSRCTRTCYNANRCCRCADKRPEGTYLRFVDGHGDQPVATRDEYYCPACKGSQ